MNRKKPRIIEIPESLEVTQEEFEDYLLHAKRSALHYALNSGKTSGQIKEKLIDKGYIDEPVKIIAEDSISERNIIQEVLEYLSTSCLVNDVEIAEYITHTQKRAGKGNREIRRKLLDKKISEDIIQETLVDEEI